MDLPPTCPTLQAQLPTPAPGVKTRVVAWEEVKETFFFLLFRATLAEVPRLGVQSELLPLTYTTATATSDPSHV